MELLVAVAALVAVLAGAGGILTSTGRVASVARANEEVLAEAAAIERRLRDDLTRLAPDGLVAIRGVAVPNDVRGAALLDPTRPASAWIRSDQLLVFANGVETAQTTRLGAGAAHRGAATSARVYFGHGASLGAASLPVITEPDVRALDPVARLTPWTTGSVMLQETRFEALGDDDVFRPVGPLHPVTVAPTTTANGWPLVRQAVLLVDDDLAPPASNAKTVYLGGAGEGGVLSARSLFLDDPRPAVGHAPQIAHGRVDAAATSLAQVRRLLTHDPDGAPRPWRDDAFTGPDAYDLVSESLVVVPRAERRPPSVHRVDEALAAHVLGTACSAVEIEWTWRDGTGAAGDVDGVRLAPGAAQPWFGLPDPDALRAGSVAPRGAVSAYGDPAHQAAAGYRPATTITASNIERLGALDALPGAVCYEAFFGFNRDEPLVTDPDDPDVGRPRADLAYTPWPSAVRVTLVLHDARGILEQGRRVQFVIDLPRRSGGRS